MDAVILPIWHGVQRDDVLNFSPTLADKVAASTVDKSIREVAIALLRVIKPNLFQSYQRLRAISSLPRSGSMMIDPQELEKGPIRREKLPARLLVRIRLFREILSDVFPCPFDEVIDGFRRDLHVTSEISIWERIAATYFQLTHDNDLETKSATFKALLLISMGFEPSQISRETGLSENEVERVTRAYVDIVPIDYVDEQQSDDEDFGEISEI